MKPAKLRANRLRASGTNNWRNGLLLDEGIRKKEKRGKMISIRLQASVDAYLRRIAKTMGGITPVLVDALRLREGLGEGLAPHKVRLQRFALDEGLDWMTQEIAVYTRAIERGLEAAEQKRK